MDSGLGRNRPRRRTDHYHSGESSNTIAAGEPVALKMSGTEDGALIERVVSSSSGAVGNQLLVGVALSSIAPDGFGEILVSGYIEDLRAVRWTRGASTNSHASAAAVAIGDQLVIETVAGGFSRQAAAATGANFNAVALQTLASVAALTASTTSVTATSSIDTIRAFIRILQLSAWSTGDFFLRGGVPRFLK